ncbi:helix-turn-helix domain-containing protein [Saccharothrix sp. AJ9571]|nr:helix-turn-helix domain-containing protein [Saccharothrix sp. AJ9571]
MSDLFGLLEKRAEANARAEVVAYAREIPDYRREAADPRGHAAMLDYAIWMRRHTVEMTRGDDPLGESALAFIGEIGRERASNGFSTGAAESVLVLHANLMLHEIHDAAGDGEDLNQLLQLTAWFGAQGLRGTAAYMRGYLDEQALRVKLAQRIRNLAESLLVNAATAGEIARSLGVTVHEEYVAVVVRCPEKSGELAEEIVELAFKQHAVPAFWREPDELVALLPAGRDEPLTVVRAIAELAGGPCAVGAAPGRSTALAEAVAVARRVAQVAPRERVPRAIYGIPEVFVELGVAHVPEVDEWLGDLVRRLANGPDLVVTLDVYYRNDMNRLTTALALHIHPRTLDYRLGRVRELTGVDPGSVRGIRILSSAVARALREPG